MIFTFGMVGVVVVVVVWFLHLVLIWFQILLMLMWPQTREWSCFTRKQPFWLSSRSHDITWYCMKCVYEAGLPCWNGNMTVCLSLQVSLHSLFEDMQREYEIHSSTTPTSIKAMPTSAKATPPPSVSSCTSILSRFKRYLVKGWHDNLLDIMCVGTRLVSYCQPCESNIMVVTWLYDHDHVTSLWSLMVNYVWSEPMLPCSR